MNVSPKEIMLTLILATLVVAAACSDDDDDADAGGGGDTDTDTDGDGDGDSDGDSDGDGDTDSDSDGDCEPVTCETIHQGRNCEFDVDGMAREFYLHLPDGVEDGGPWPVVFNWHGLGDTASNMSGMFSGLVNNADWPFIAVTPEDSDFAIESGMLGTIPVDWDTFQYTEDNIEVAFFDALLACLDERYDVDENHIHSTGFSIGSILTDLIASVRGDVLASVGTWSGGYWNNPSTDLGLLGLVVSWPEYETANTYPQLFVHGGAADIYDMMVVQLQFNVYAVNDATWFNTMGRDIVICNHDSGHTVPGDIGGARMIQFFQDHPLGTTASPWASGLPAEYPDYCTFSGATK